MYQVLRDTEEANLKHCPAKTRNGFQKIESFDCLIKTKREEQQEDNQTRNPIWFCLAFIDLHLVVEYLLILGTMKFIGISAAGLLLSSTASPVASAASNTSLRGRFEKDVSSPVLKERNLGYSFGEECVCAPGYDSECTPKCDPVDKLCKPGEELDCIYHEKWDLDDEEVPVKIGNMRVNDPVGSYWTVDFTPSNGENNFVPAWCVDVGRGLSNQNWIEADLYSSYSKNIPNDQDDPRKRAVDKLKFLPAINYLLNAEDLQPGQTVPSNICPGAPTISWSDFQKAVWQLIDNQDTSFAGLKQSQMDECVYNYITTRGSSKFDYEPKCGDKLGVLVIVDRSNDVIYKQVIIAVVDDAPCTECPDGCIDYESFQKDEHPVHIEDGRLLGKASSYWRVDLNLTDGIEAYHETWCVDKDRSLSPSYRDADIYSIYDDTIDPAVLEEAVEEYQNLPAVNFLVNYFEQGQTVGTCGVAITWREMQSAIWSLVESPGDNTAISGYDSCSAAYMKWYALEHGADYVPTCYEPMLVLVIIDRDNGDIRKQVIASLVTPDCDECTEPVCDPDVCELIPYDNSHGPGLHDDCYSISNDINPNFYSDCQDGLWCVGQWGGIWGQAKCFPAGEFGDGGHSKPWNYDEYAPVPSNPLPTQYVPLDCAIDNSVDCPSKNNLGPLLLGDLPPEQYDVIKAHAQSTLTATGASVVVGGDFHSIIGAEVEGLAVVLGDLVIEKYGAHSWCRAGVGSGVGPSADDYCLIGKSTNHFDAIQMQERMLIIYISFLVSLLQLAVMFN